MRRLLPVALLAAACLVGGVAVIDHRNETARGRRAEVREWYCEHQRTRCGGPASAAIERHWNERELAYEVVVAGLLAAAATVAVHRVDRRWRRA